MNNTILGKRIKELRTNNNLNQKEFAESIGITQSTLSSYENGNAMPSNDVLVEIATKYHMSLDWLFGLSTSQTSITSIGDIADILFQIDEFKELRFELEINDHLPNDIETEENRWYTAIKFYGNDSEHPQNASMCQLLGSFEENRNSFETYWTTKELFDIWKRNRIEHFSEMALTKKEYHELDNTTRLKLRNELLEKNYGPKKD